MLREDHRERCIRIAEALPVKSAAYDQAVWMIMPDHPRPVCVGAHLAKHYDRPQFNTECYSFHQGKKALANDLDLAPHRLQILLTACGAPLSPFGTEPWTTHPKEVFRNLADLTDPVATEIIRLAYINTVRESIAETPAEEIP